MQPYFEKIMLGLTSYLKNDFVILDDVCEGRFSGITTIDLIMSGDNEWCYINKLVFLECKVKQNKDKIEHLFDTKQVLCCVRKQELPFLEMLKNCYDVFLCDIDILK